MSSKTLLDATPQELVEYILRNHHRPWSARMQGVRALARELSAAHGAQAAERLGALEILLRQLEFQQNHHMRKEESVLFPAIMSERYRLATGPMAVMSQEHRAIDAMLLRLRALMDDFEVSSDAPALWRQLVDALVELERDLTVHSRLEDELLFPAVRARIT